MNLQNELPFGEDFKNAWHEWIIWRKEMRFKKYAPMGLKKTLSHLQNISNNDEKTAIEIINQSIIQNWQGLFPLKNGYADNSQNKTGTSEARINAVKNWSITNRD
jgi:hypothetical protein